MKYVFLSLFNLILGQNAFSACLDISGQYTMGGNIYVKYQQNSCESLTEEVCVTKNNCFDAYTWPLNGDFQQDGPDASRHASISIVDQFLFRTNALQNSVVLKKRQCVWNEFFYAKDQAGNLIVSYKLNCLTQAGSYGPYTKTEKWLLVK